MKKFYLPPQLGSIPPQNYVKVFNPEISEFPEKNVDKVEEYSNKQNINSDVLQSDETQDLSIEQALKEYYDYINNQNK